MNEVATYPSLKNKTVLVTGGGTGIGEAIVTRFAEQGAKVGFLDIAKDESTALADRLTQAGHTVEFGECDITDTDALRSAIAGMRKSLGPITILINNAAHDQRHRFEDITPEFFDERIAVNIKQQFFATQAVIGDMQSAGGGVVINMGSVSWMKGQGGMACYTAAKSAVIGFTRSIARDYGADNIRALSVVPGWIMTDRQRELWLTPEGEEELMQSQCIKRRLLPDDIARPVLFFASDEAAGCTNQSYVIDGGWI